MTWFRCMAGEQIRRFCAWSYHLDLSSTPSPPGSVTLLAKDLAWELRWPVGLGALIPPGTAADESTMIHPLDEPEGASRPPLDQGASFGGAGVKMAAVSSASATADWLGRGTN